MNCKEMIEALPLPGKKKGPPLQPDWRQSGVRGLIQTMFWRSIRGRKWSGNTGKVSTATGATPSQPPVDIQRNLTA